MGESTGQQSTERHLKHKNKKLNSTEQLPHPQGVIEMKRLQMKKQKNKIYAKAQSL